MKKTVSIISYSVAAALLGLVAVAANAQAGLVTWTLKGVSQFTSGESATGYFTLDPAKIAAAPPGPTDMAGWNIVVTGGTNPQIPTITFSSTDTGCVVACARFFKSAGPVIIDFRGPLSPENTFYEFGLGILAGSDALIFPTSQELTLISVASHIPATTHIEFGEYLASQHEIHQIATSQLEQGGAIVTTAAIPEAATFELLAMGLAVMGACFVFGRSAPARR